MASIEGLSQVTNVIFSVFYKTHSEFLAKSYPLTSRVQPWNTTDNEEAHQQITWYLQGEDTLGMFLSFTVYPIGFFSKKNEIVVESGVIHDTKELHFTKPVSFKVGTPLSDDDHRHLEMYVFYYHHLAMKQYELVLARMRAHGVWAVKPNAPSQ